MLTSQKANIFVSRMHVLSTHCKRPPWTRVPSERFTKHDTDLLSVFVPSHPIDFRMRPNGLLALVRDTGSDPFSGAPSSAGIAEVSGSVGSIWCRNMGSSLDDLSGQHERASTKRQLDCGRWRLHEPSRYSAAKHPSAVRICNALPLVAAVNLSATVEVLEGSAGV